MENYNDLLLSIEKIKNEPDSPLRSEAISAVKQLVRTFDEYIRTMKTQMIKDPTLAGLDFDFLSSFFENNKLTDHEMKLKELRKKLREISSKDA